MFRKSFIYCIQRDINFIKERELFITVKRFMAASGSDSRSSSLHEARGRGSSLQMHVDISKLEEAGWSIISRKSGSRVHISFRDPEGRKFRSAKDMECKLEADGTQLLKVNSNTSVVEREKYVACVQDSDEDYNR